MCQFSCDQTMGMTVTCIEAFGERRALQAFEGGENGGLGDAFAVGNAVLAFI